MQSAAQKPIYFISAGLVKQTDVLESDLDLQSRSDRRTLVDLLLALLLVFAVMAGLAVSTFLTSVLLPTTATLAEDLPAAAGRSPPSLQRRARPKLPP